jgi:REP element-mobilizing transposase RayT
MIIAYHAIFTTYGTWLPNDPRGSFSKDVYIEQIKSLGKVRYGRQNPQPQRKTLLKVWTQSKTNLSRSQFFINDSTRAVIAKAFAELVSRLNLSVSACAIMNDHVHILVLSSKYNIEYIVNQLKGSATKALKLKNTPWTRGCWKIFINDTQALKSAVDYINANPETSGLSPQSWGFVTPLTV